MNLKKPKFWDYKSPNIFAYLLLPLAVLIQLKKLFESKPKLEITLRGICEFCHSNNNYIIFINNCNEIFLTKDPDYHNIQKQVLDFHYLNNKVSNEIGKELYDKNTIPNIKR